MMGPSNQMAPGAERPEHPAMSSRPPLRDENFIRFDFREGEADAYAHLRRALELSYVQRGGGDEGGGGRRNG